MKANELRIGNYTEQGKINSFWEGGICLKYGKSFKFSELNPIPLTEDILLKCGIEIDGSFGHIKHFESIYLLKPWIEADHFLLKTIGGECISKIKHLHQLQNLYFALTNGELKIEL